MAPKTSSGLRGAICMDNTQIGPITNSQALHPTAGEELRTVAVHWRNALPSMPAWLRSSIWMDAPEYRTPTLLVVSSKTEKLSHEIVKDGVGVGCEIKA